MHLTGVHIDAAIAKIDSLLPDTITPKLHTSQNRSFKRYRKMTIFRLFINLVAGLVSNYAFIYLIYNSILASKKA
jgi:hypothetical protein